MAGNTIDPIKLDIAKLETATFEAFVAELWMQVTAFEQTNAAFYADQTKTRSRFVFWVRPLLAGIGAFAVLATAAAAALRVADTKDHYDVAAFALALACYAIVGAIVFYDRASQTSDTYFRALGVRFAESVRWTKFEFDALRLPRKLTSNGDATADATAAAAAREQWIALAQAYCQDLNALAVAEVADLRTGYKAAMTDLDTISKAGIDSATKGLTDALAAHAALLQQAATNAAAAAKAGAPAFVNLTVNGDFDGQLQIFVDKKLVDGAAKKQVVLSDLAPGVHTLEARGKKGTADVSAISAVTLASGIQAETLTLS